jgi:hypothetical protein
MKIINDWPSLNKLNISAADQPVLANGDSLYYDSLYYSFYHYHYEGMSVDPSTMLFYYIVS